MDVDWWKVGCNFFLTILSRPGMPEATNPGEFYGASFSQKKNGWQKSTNCSNKGCDNDNCLQFRDFCRQPPTKIRRKSDKMPSHVVRFVYLKGIIANSARFRNRHLGLFHPLKVLNLKPSGHRFTKIQYFFSRVKASNFVANFTESQIGELFEFTLPKSHSSSLRTGRAPQKKSSNHPFSVE